MRRRVVLLTLAGLLAVGVSSAGAAQRQVSIKNLAYSPFTSIALTGDTVTWTNNETVPGRPHNVVSDTGAWAPVTPFGSGGTFAQTFATNGTFNYHCAVHFGMHGTVRVVGLYLTGPASPVLFGRNVTLTGYAPESSGTVDINKVSGAANPVATVPVNATTGKFTATFLAAPGQYQAATASPARTSALVKVNVKPKLTVTKRRQGRTFWITVKTTPNQTGATMVLEKKKGFGWKKLASHRLGAASKTVFKLVVTEKVTVRLRLSAPVGGYAKTTSSALTLRP